MIGGPAVDQFDPLQVAFGPLVSAFIGSCACLRQRHREECPGSISGAILQNCALTAPFPCSVTGASRTTPYGVLLTLSSPGRVLIHYVAGGDSSAGK
ncbi:hypothetical protein PGTUg99_015920 [Puccinia graminis f. sp. tritici]|uniref:Uncharacterized protein n=2 Tax=Puccinia graminis f. sp. tritici TaxID=56615 RepID=H6QQG1_PUCGT|nr:uncharacterized protein PGTG_21118 [Puccinia graminis f. sp. tritici CRL 75-36-700-3]EHS62572.1 hypothetical protein PGTG_21118 [Puccinia graminis f. sp. tritici CRL 75-36-700-3]KAA1130956.1 hypothetical protein PGTUg99_015920 [Puccinia graminis f. sp. tritici]